METKQRVECFDLSNPQEKLKYEYILNKYQVINTEFAYTSREGIPKVTVWWVQEED